MRTVKLADGITYRPIVSRRFICPKCNIFCTELVPVLKLGMKKPPGFVNIQVHCRNGCNLTDPDWGFETFSWGEVKAEKQVKDWPSQWKGK